MTDILNVGRVGDAGLLRVRDANASTIVSLDAAQGQIAAGRTGVAGRLRLADGVGRGIIALDAQTGRLVAGKQGVVDGSILLIDADGTRAVLSAGVVAGIVADVGALLSELFWLQLDVDQLESRVRALEAAV